MPTTLDLPVPILRAIGDNPNVPQHWHELADWLAAQAHDDEAVAVRTLWPTLRENLAVVSLEETLADVAKNAALLAKIARKMPRHDDETPPV